MSVVGIYIYESYYNEILIERTTFDKNSGAGKGVLIMALDSCIVVRKIFIKQNEFFLSFLKFSSSIFIPKVHLSDIIIEENSFTESFVYLRKIDGMVNNFTIDYGKNPINIATSTNANFFSLDSVETIKFNEIFYINRGSHSNSIFYAINSSISIAKIKIHMNIQPSALTFEDCNHTKIEDSFFYNCTINIKLIK